MLLWLLLLVQLCAYTIFHNFYYHITRGDFLRLALANSFSWNLKYSKSPQVSSIFLNILADLNNTGVWMVTTGPLISKSSISLNSPLGIILSTTIALLFSNIILLLEIFYWSLRDSKSPQVSRTLLSILAVLSNALVRMVSPYSPTSKSFSPFNNPLVIVPKAPITIGTIVTFMFHSYFNSLARSRYVSFFSLSFSFFCGQPWQQSPQFCKFSFSCLLLGLVFWVRLGDPFVYERPKGVYVCHSSGQMLGCVYTICSHGQI